MKLTLILKSKDQDGKTSKSSVSFDADPDIRDSAEEDLTNLVAGWRKANAAKRAAEAGK